PCDASLSSVGMGITPPNVLPAPKPVSSVMIRRMFGAPLGGTTRGGHQDFDWSALRSIVPPKGSSGGGSCFPSSVTVAAGEPPPLPCWACAAGVTIEQESANTRDTTSE